MEFQNIKDILLKILCVRDEDILPTSTLRDDLGADSLDLYDAFSTIEKEYKIRITSDRVEKIITVDDLVAVIKER